MSQWLDMSDMSRILDTMSTHHAIVSPTDRPGPSFEEKSVWIQFAAMLIGMGVYFIIAGRLLASGERAMPAFAALLIVATIFMTVLLVAGHIVAAVTRAPEPADERDRLIAWKAEFRSSWLVAVGVCGAITLMTLGADNVWSANVLMLFLALSELLCLGLRLIAYRRGA